MNLLRAVTKASILAVFVAAAATLPAAQLSTDARTAIPHETQQLIAIDYRAMQNSAAATELRDRVMPPELKQFDEALRKSGLNDNHDVEQLTFALFRPQNTSPKIAGKPADGLLDSIGIAEGQFPVQEILANFRKQKLKAALVRTNKLYPMGKTGMVLCFVDASTMVFGSSDAVKAALDARDGVTPNLLTNAPMMDAMKSVDSQPLWSVLDEKGTEFMVHQLLGNAGSLTNFDTVRKHLQSCRYGMDFQHGVRLNLSIETGDDFIAATLSSIFNAAITVRKITAPEVEKQALAATSVSSSSGNLEIQFAASDDEFASLLKSSLFQSVLA